MKVVLIYLGVFVSILNSAWANSENLVSELNLAPQTKIVKTEVLIGIINDLIVGKSSLNVAASCSTGYCGCYDNSDHYGNCSNFISCCPGYSCVGGRTAGWGKCK